MFSSLRDLYLGSNPISVEGGSAMSDIIWHNILSMDKLDLCDDSIGKEGVLQLIKSLKLIHGHHTGPTLWLPERYKSKVGSYVHTYGIYWN